MESTTSKLNDTTENDTLCHEMENDLNISCSRMKSSEEEEDGAVKKDEHGNINCQEHDGDAAKSTKQNEDKDDMECTCPICLRSAMEICHGRSSTKAGSRSGQASNAELRSNCTNGISSTNRSDILSDFVYSSTCGHIYCFPCIKHLLLYSPPKRNSKSHGQFISDDDNKQVEPIITMTQNICPMCRAELSYFDLKKIYIEMDEQIQEESTSKYKIIRSDDMVVPNKDTTTLPKELFGKKYRSIKEGMHPKVDTLVAAFRFPNFDSDSTTTSSNFKTKDGDNVDFAKGIQMSVVVRGGDKEELSSYLTIEKFQYLSSTHTFKGWATKMVQLTDEIGKHDAQVVQFCVWMTFSDDFQFVTHGVTRTIQPTPKCLVPFHDRTVDHGVVIISVHGGDSEDQMIRVCPTNSIDPTSNVSQPVPIPGKSLVYMSSILWGNVFCKGFAVGFASLHFIRPPKNNRKNQDDGMAFISYEHPKSSRYLPLDNGRPLPSRALFRNINCPNPFTFCGSICWEEDYGSTWHGSSRWDFKIKFDTKFVCIHSGTVHSVTTNRNKEDNLQENQGETIKLEFTFGTDDVTYVNAGLPSFTEKMKTKFGDEFRGIFRTINVKDDPMTLLKTMLYSTWSKCGSITSRLVDEKVPVNTICMVTFILKYAWLAKTRYELTQIMKDLAHTKRMEIQLVCDELEQTLLPIEQKLIDLTYFYE